jgi:hypothetical protein
VFEFGFCIYRYWFLKVIVKNEMDFYIQNPFQLEEAFAYLVAFILSKEFYYLSIVLMSGRIGCIGVIGQPYTDMYGLSYVPRGPHRKCVKIKAAMV